jgi:hypothetical protein
MFRVTIAALLNQEQSPRRYEWRSNSSSVRQGRHPNDQSREIAILASIIDPPHTEAAQLPNDAGRGNSVFSTCHAAHQACGGVAAQLAVGNTQQVTNTSHEITLWQLMD